VFTHASNPRILLQPEAFGLSQPLYRLHIIIINNINIIISIIIIIESPINPNYVTTATSAVDSPP